MNITQAYNITYEDHRCDECGRFWASEVSWKSKTCPFCASKQIKDAINQRDSALRSAASLRGVISRMKK